MVLQHARCGPRPSAHAFGWHAHVPAQPPRRNHHVLSMTFVGVVRQAQWFDQQAGERASRRRTISGGTSRERLRSGPASGGTDNAEVVAAFERVRAFEGEAGGGRRRWREGGCTCGWQGGCWPREMRGQRRGRGGGGRRPRRLGRASCRGPFMCEAVPARTGGRREAGACGLSARLGRIHISRDRFKVCRSAARILGAVLAPSSGDVCDVRDVRTRPAAARPCRRGSGPPWPAEALKLGPSHTAARTKPLK